MGKKAEPGFRHCNATIDGPDHTLLFCPKWDREREIITAVEIGVKVTMENVSDLLTASRDLVRSHEHGNKNYGTKDAIRERQHVIQVISLKQCLEAVPGVLTRSLRYEARPAVQHNVRKYISLCPEKKRFYNRIGVIHFVAKMRFFGSRFKAISRNATDQINIKRFRDSFAYSLSCEDKQIRRNILQCVTKHK